MATGIDEVGDLVDDGVQVVITLPMRDPQQLISGILQGTVADLVGRKNAVGAAGDSGQAHVTGQNLVGLATCGAVAVVHQGDGWDWGRQCLRGCEAKGFATLMNHYIWESAK